jgi:hypothetical protein
VSVLRQAELGMAVGDIVRQLGISEQTFYQWKKQYGGMHPKGVRELKILHDKNARSKKWSLSSAWTRPSCSTSTQKSGTARAETGSSELHCSALRFEAGAGLLTDESGTQHAVPSQQEGPEAAATPASTRAGAGTPALGLPAPAYPAQA